MHPFYALCLRHMYQYELQLSSALVAYWYTYAPRSLLQHLTVPQDFYSPLSVSEE